jgi:hypothetical protein
MVAHIVIATIYILLQYILTFGTYVKKNIIIAHVWYYIIALY